MLKLIMENQDKPTPVPQQNTPNTTLPDPPAQPPQPADDQTPPPTNADQPVTAPVSGGASQSNDKSAAPVNIPSEWPGAFKIYKISKAAVSQNMSAIVGLVGCIVLTVIIYILILMIAKGLAARYIVEFIFYLINFIISGALVYACLESVRGHKTTVGAAFSVAMDKWINIIITSLIVGVLLLISIVLFIIPFFFIFPRLSLALYNVIDKDMGPVEAIQASWAQTKGNVSKVYGIVGVTILILIPTITIIGVILTLYLDIMYAAAYAILFLYITNKPAGATPTNDVATPPPSINPAPSQS